MLSKFFLDRPVFAWVIAIIIMLAGGLAIYNLPISQYPPIAPPSIYISTFYPGGLRGDGGKQRDPDHRAEDDRSRQDDLSLRHERFGRLLPHRSDLRPGHRPGPRLGQGPEQAPARHGEPAGRGAAPGRPGGQGHPELADDHRACTRKTAAWTATT